MATSPLASPEVILLVDDDAAVLEAIKFLLELQNFVVRPFPDGEALLARSDLPEHGCLVLDYRLPGIDGLQLLRQLRGRGVSLPAVLITTPTTKVRALAEQAGIAVVEKPLLGDTLTETVRRLVARGSRADGASGAARNEP